MMCKGHFPLPMDFQSKSESSHHSINNRRSLHIGSFDKLEIIKHTFTDSFSSLFWLFWLAHVSQLIIFRLGFGWIGSVQFVTTFQWTNQTIGRGSSYHILIFARRTFLYLIVIFQVIRHQSNSLCLPIFNFWKWVCFRFCCSLSVL